MRFIKLLNLTLFFYFGALINTYAFKIEKIGIEKGLSNNNVVSIAQDRAGFIWIATKDGLNRFNSGTFHVFRNIGDGTNSLHSNALNCVYADKIDDVVWVASERNGVDAYNYKTHVFTHYRHDYSNPETNDLSANGITYINGDEEGNIWFATYDAGIDYLDRKTMRFTNYNQSNTPGLGSNYNWCVLNDTDEKVYVGHVFDGFSIINTKTKTAVNFKHNPNDPASLPDNTVTSLLKDSQGRIWIGTRNGLCLFNPENGQMMTFRNNPDNQNSISGNFIQKTLETPENKLYIGTEGGGLNILDLREVSFSSAPSTFRFKRILVSETAEGLSSLSVQAVFRDSFGNIWLGGLGGGINFIPSHESNFSTIIHLPYIENKNSLNDKSVVGICVDNNDHIWLANGSGGIAVYKKGEKIRQINTINNTFGPRGYISIYKALNNKIWIATDKGDIFIFDGNLNRFTTFNGFNLQNYPIYSFFEDSKNKIWLATDIGLHKYDSETGACIVFNTGNSDLPDNLIRTIAEDGNQNIWVGTLTGSLFVFDQNFKLLRDYTQAYDFYSVNHIYKDSKNRMWIGSQNDLFLIKPQNNDSIMRIGKISGLSENNVRAIIEGSSENEIWLSTTNGISHIDLNTMNVNNYDASDGIVLGDYLNGSVTKTSDGCIYFGSQNGITWFNQSLAQSTIPNPLPAFTSFAVASNKNYLNQFTEIPFDNEIKLKHNQNSFQISFNVLDYSKAKKVEFVYQMKGLNDGWYLVNTGNEVTFRNLYPGDYTFNLKTRLHNNEWSDIVSSMHITIDPPLWLSVWAKIFYLFLIVLVIYFILRFYKYKLKIENSLELEKISHQQEHELNEEKMKFFTNITHELRSPLTLILGPLEDLMYDAAIPPEQAKKILSIHRVANRLLHLINQILEFRKSTNKNRKLRVLKDDFVKYIYDTGLKYKELSHNKNVEFKIDVPDVKIELFFDPEVVTIILDNLLSNAFKYTQEGMIRLKLNNYVDGNIDYTEIIVADTGFGISENDLPHIFERFFQAKNTSYPVPGTGIGLALVQNMVELHEAEISVNSQLNKGTTFKVKFITNNSYPEAIHILPAEGQSEVSGTAENSKNVILVVDDNQEIIEYICDCLMDSYVVITAENGNTGFQTACDKVPDLVISDVMMPVMDGIEMCKAMKQDVRTSHIPVVLLTAKGSLQDQREGYDAGADSYLTKPFSGNLLKSRLRNILDARKKLSAEYSSKFKDKQLLFNESINQLDKEFLEKLTAVIENNLEDEELNITLVSSQLNMSHSTLYRKIKALTNLTANEYIRKVRIRVAEQLLLTNKYTISEIMYRIGINSSSYFRQCFKDEFGMNPSEYLQKLKENEH